MQKSKVETLLSADSNEAGDKENINTKEERHDNIAVSEVRKKSLKDVPNGTDKLIDCGKKTDTRKRYSIGNGELRVNGKTREVSPTTRMAQQRKLSADMRLRSGIHNAGDEYVGRRPVRLKCMMNNLEVYDSLHTKAVSILAINYYLRHSTSEESIRNEFYFLCTLLYYISSHQVLHQLVRAHYAWEA